MKKKEGFLVGNTLDDNLFKKWNLLKKFSTNLFIENLEKEWK